MKTQAWGWLIAAVAAAALNASYHDGGFHWAHEIADQVGHNTNAVLALATGRADQFLAESRLLTARSETSSCRLATALARVQSRIARSQAGFDRFEAMSARQEAQMARFEAKRARMEAQLARVRIPAVSFVSVDAPKIVCPRVQVNVPHIPQVRMPQIPTVHFENPGPGPV